jgi:hypothetical protein
VDDRDNERDVDVDAETDHKVEEEKVDTVAEERRCLEEMDGVVVVGVAVVET